MFSELRNFFVGRELEFESIGSFIAIESMIFVALEPDRVRSAVSTINVRDDIQDIAKDVDRSGAGRWSPPHLTERLN